MSCDLYRSTYVHDKAVKDRAAPRSLMVLEGEDGEFTMLRQKMVQMNYIGITPLGDIKPLENKCG